MPFIKNKKKLFKRMKEASVKRANRTPNSNVGKVTSALASVSMHHNKLLGSLFDTMFFECRAMREQENNLYVNAVTPGSIPLLLNTTTAASKEFPLHIWDLTGIPNDGVTFRPGQILYFDAAETPYFQSASTTAGNLPFLVAQGPNDGGTWSASQSFNRTLQNYYDVRLDLFPRDKYNTEYTISLLRITDETMAPATTASTTLYNHNAFWKHMVRPYYTNTLAPSDQRYMSDLKGKFKVIWEKTYKVGERKNDVDSFKPRRIKLFKMLNAVHRYNEQASSISYGGDDPNVSAQGTVNGNSSTQCRISQRIYMVIRANQTQDVNSAGYDTTGVNGADACSYSLYLRSKHTVPQTGV